MEFKIWMQLQENPVANAAPAFDRVSNLTQTGKYFNDFFSRVSSGEFGRSEVDYAHELEMHPDHQPFEQELYKHTGHFDDHIAKSIPTYRETQIRKGHAIASAFKDKQAKMLDIGGSEGSFAKAVTQMSRGMVQTTVLDPNQQMANFFQKKSQVQGSRYEPKAFIKGWHNDDGTEVPALNADTTTERYDVIHEAMTFQFISNQRTQQVAEAKRLLAPGGLFITEEKLRTHEEDWHRYEQFKDQTYKNKYYTSQDLSDKQKIVGFQQTKQNQPSMMDNMVSQEDYENLLTSQFAEVWQYWDSGNFKGYAASDDGTRVRTFVQAMGNMNSKFANTKLPRRVTRGNIKLPVQQPTQYRKAMGETTMVPFRKWSEAKDHKEVILMLLPEKDKLEKMCPKYVKKEFKQKILDQLKKQTIDLEDDVLERILDDILNPHELPDFDELDYHTLL